MGEALLATVAFRDGTVLDAQTLVDRSIDDWRPDVGRYRRVIDVLVQGRGGSKQAVSAMAADPLAWRRRATRPIDLASVPGSGDLRRLGSDKTTRTVAFRQGKSIPALTAMFQHIIASNRAGGWRKLKRCPRACRQAWCSSWATDAWPHGA